MTESKLEDILSKMAASRGTLDNTVILVNGLKQFLEIVRSSTGIWVPHAIEDIERISSHCRAITTLGRRCSRSAEGLCHSHKPVSEMEQCQANTLKNTRCKRRKQKGNEKYCTSHEKKARENPMENPEDFGITFVNSESTDNNEIIIAQESSENAATNNSFIITETFKEATHLNAVAINNRPNPYDVGEDYYNVIITEVDIATGIIIDRKVPTKEVMLCSVRNIKPESVKQRHKFTQSLFFKDLYDKEISERKRLVQDTNRELLSILEGMELDKNIPVIYFEESLEKMKSLYKEVKIDNKKTNREFKKYFKEFIRPLEKKGREYRYIPISYELFK